MKNRKNRNRRIMEMKTVVMKEEKGYFLMLKGNI
jgi:hypothetical protein